MIDQTKLQLQRTVPIRGHFHLWNWKSKKREEWKGRNKLAMRGEETGVNGGKTEHRNNGGLVFFKSGMVGGDVTRMMKYKSCKGRKSIH